MQRSPKVALSIQMREALEEIAAEKGLRVENARRKINTQLKREKLLANEKAKQLFVEGLVKRYKHFLKDANRKRLRKGILEVIRFLPPEVTLQLEKKLNCPPNNPSALIQALLERVVFVPQKEFSELSNILFGENGREPSACAYKGYAFLNLKKQPKERIYGDASHELVHMIKALTNLPYGLVQDEALAVSIGMYIKAKKSARMRQVVQNKSRERYREEKDTEEYVGAVNLGREAFLIAQKLEQAHGPKTAMSFFHKLFMVRGLNSGTISLAAQAAKHEAQK